MRTWPARLVLGLTASLSACTPASAPPPAPVAPPPRAALAIAPAQPDMSPVAEPRGLIGMAHARNVGATIDAAGRLARLPLSLRSLVQAQLSEHGRDMIKLDGSFDAVFVLDPASTDEEPKVMAAFSLPVVTIDQALSRLDRDGAEFVPIAPGVYRGLVRTEAESSPPPPPSGGDEAPKASTPLQCDLAMSVGDAPARLICADTANELDLLRPWMTRGMPLASYGSADLHAELRFAPLQARYSPVLRTQADALSLQAAQWLETDASIREPLLLQAPGVALQEGVRFVDDLDVLSMDMSLDAGAMQASATGRLRFKGRTSWLTQVLTDPNDKAAPPAPIFWRAPRDSDTVTFGRGVDPKRYEGIRRVVLTAASTLLPQTRLPERTRAAIEDYIATFPVHDADVVSAQGFIPPAARSKPAAQRKPADAIAEARDFANQYVGWSVVGIEHPSAEYTTWLRKTGALCIRLLQDARSDKELGPILRKETWIPNVQIVDHPAGLPRGSVALDFTVRFDSKMVWDLTRLGRDQGATPHPAGPAAKGSVTVRVAVVPDGPSRTWIATSADLPSLQAHMKAVVSGAPDAGTISSLPELASLRSERVTSAGMVVYGRIIQKTLASLRDADPALRVDAVDQVMASLPNRLMTPLLLVGRGTGGAAPVDEIEVRVLRGTFDDLAALIAFAMTEKGRALLESIDKPAP